MVSGSTTFFFDFDIFSMPPRMSGSPRPGMHPAGVVLAGIRGQHPFTDSEFDTARPGASPAFAYLRGTIQNTLGDTGRFQIVSQLQGQISTGPLVSSEQFAIGGRDSVRGYPESAGLGDAGLLGRLELRGPSIAPLKMLGRLDVTDRLYFLTFVDAGIFFNQDAQDGYPSQGYAIGAGVGLRYQLSQYITVNYDYGRQLADDDVNSEKDYRHHVAINASFSW